MRRRRSASWRAIVSRICSEIRAERSGRVRRAGPRRVRNDRRPINSDNSATASSGSPQPGQRSSARSSTGPSRQTRDLHRKHLKWAITVSSVDLGALEPDSRQLSDDIPSRWAAASTSRNASSQDPPSANDASCAKPSRVTGTPSTSARRTTASAAAVTASSRGSELAGAADCSGSNREPPFQRPRQPLRRFGEPRDRTTHRSGLTTQRVGASTPTGST